MSFFFLTEDFILFITFLQWKSYRAMLIFFFCIRLKLTPTRFEEWRHGCCCWSRARAAFFSIGRCRHGNIIIKAKGSQGGEVKRSGQMSVVITWHWGLRAAREIFCDWGFRTSSYVAASLQYAQRGLKFEEMWSIIYKTKLYVFAIKAKINNSKKKGNIKWSSLKGGAFGLQCEDIDFSLFWGTLVWPLIGIWIW